MDKSFWLLLVLLASLVAMGAAELAWHRRNLRMIRHRIHVNGTRGKSSVTRLIAAGLREGGIRTCGKTTGTLPRMLLPDGTEVPVFRPARANIIEQVRIVAAAQAQQAHALVIECMALIPHLQWLSEARLIRATVGVITNARADHLDVMGPDEPDVALALAGMIPQGGKLFTAEQRHLATLQQCCSDRNCTLFHVTADMIAAVTASDLSGFRYVEHGENVALALHVCEHLGVERNVALRGMWAAAPDPGVLTEFRLGFFGREIVFVNGFAANDPESSKRIWDLAQQRHPHLTRKLLVFNCREDRPDRTRQLATAASTWPPVDATILMGTGTYLFAREASRQQTETTSIDFVFAEGQEVPEIFETIISHVGNSALVMGLGNIGGQGLALAQYFSNRSHSKEMR